MNKKEVKNKIKELHGQSLNKAEIYIQLEGLIEEDKKDWLARQLAAITDPLRIKKYNILNKILLLILFLQSSTFIIQTSMSFSKVWQIRQLIEVILGTTLGFIFFIGIYKHKLFFYSTLITISLLGNIFILFYLIIGIYPLNYLWIAVYHLMTLLYIYQVRKRIIPEIDFRGNVRKDKDGNYIFCN